MKDRKTIKTVLITFASTVLLIVVLAFILISSIDFPYKDFYRVASIIESSYVGEYDPKKAEEAAINGLISSIGDDYAAYYNEDDLDELMTLIDGYYIGVGAEVFANTEKKRIEITAAIPGSPAEKAGIMGGDLIKEIDGKEYTDSELDNAVKYLKGIGIENPLEKEVKMTLMRGEEEYTVTLKRENINMYKVTSQIIDDICYVKYSGFTETSHQEFNKIVENLDESVKGIVIDIRDNPGGELNSAINMCDIFLEEEVVMYTLNKDGKKHVYKAKKGSVDIPLAVIVNGNSASASEVFAGAIKAHKRGVIVGEKTFGKGVTQTVIALNPISPSNGAVKLTTYKNYTPDGKWINDGITPDINAPAPTVTGDISEDQAFIEAVKSLKKDK